MPFPLNATWLLSAGLLLVPFPGAAWSQEAAPTTVRELLEVRDHHDKTTWANEVLAQKYEQLFVDLWDRLIRGSDKAAVLREFSFDSIVLATDFRATDMEGGIHELRPGSTAGELTRDEALLLLDRWTKNGYELVESEWHHSQFTPATEREGAHSTVSILLHLARTGRQERFIVRGDLLIDWKPGPQVGRIDASHILVLARQGAPAFETKTVLEYSVGSSTDESASIHPLLVHDLNHDGLPEIIVGGLNHVYWNQGHWGFSKQPFVKYPVRNVRAAVLADFTGDGNDDYLCFPILQKPLLYVGNAAGKFPLRPEFIGFLEPLEKPSAVTVGDYDGDGDLDVFIGQQKSSYSNGFIPTPYYDANDGYPFYLLANDGRGIFRDVTIDAGLGGKRQRHVFSNSFVDLDQDGDLDLLLTNDFCGSELFLNDGQGKFSNASERLKPTAHGFGMSHTFGDYNLDGRLDFISIGMSSTTARRLEYLGLHREGFEDYDARRPEMGYGNRLFLNDPSGSFVQAAFNDSCARTGWSWGSTTLDFDRDGDQDLYIANGQTSGTTTKDYCTRFWCHDLYYRPGERPDGPVSELFQKLSPLFSGYAISWNGYEHNALLMNRGEKGFANVGYLMGVAFEFDSRAALSADLDGDGRVDLLVEQKDLRGKKRNLYLVQNVWQDDHHWLGVHLRGDASDSPHGAQVRVTLADGTVLLQHLATGHSVWAQHANTIHFGCGHREPVELEIRWPSGAVSRFARPPFDRYLTVTPATRL